MKNLKFQNFGNEILQFGYHSGIWLILVLGLVYFALI